MTQLINSDTRRRVAVLVSTSRHPLSGLPCASRNDALALEIGRRIGGGAPRVLHAGDPEDPALADYLAYGAAVVEVLRAGAGADFVPALARELREALLVLCGCRSEGGIASGTLPYLLAAALKLPVIGDVLEVQLDGESVQVVQFLPKGRRRRIDVPLPAVIAIHAMAAGEPRYAYARRIAGRIETLPAPATEATAAQWSIDAVERTPSRLKAVDRRSGHARMLAATVAARRGGQVVIEGSSVAKAQAVLAYLRQHRLIDF